MNDGFPPTVRIASYAKRVGAIAIAILVICVGLFFAVEYVRPLPDNAIVFVDHETETYFSPPLIEDDFRDFLVLVPLMTCREEGWKPATTEIEMLIADKKIRDDERVLVDLKRKTFFLLPQNGYTVLEVTRRRDLPRDDYHPDWKHEGWNGFVDNYGWFGFCMKQFGLRQGRWSEDGDWNW